MLRYILTLTLLAFWCLSIGLAFAGTFTDDFSGNKLSDKWFVTKKRAVGDEIKVANGVLTFDAKGKDVVIGIRYGTIDLTKGEFILECDYITGYQQTYISFNSDPSDTEAWDKQPMFIFIAVNGVYQFVGGGGPSVDAPFTYTVGQKDTHHYLVGFTPTNDPKVYNYRTNIDKGKFEKSGKLNISTMNPAKTYVYFEIWTASGNPTVLDNIVMTSPSIADGTSSVKPSEKLSTAWGKIKNEK
ncbi:MAG: hypothetical protein AAB116_09650 [Candidatus Poribacteria bacterium]